MALLPVLLGTSCETTFNQSLPQPSEWDTAINARHEECAYFPALQGVLYTKDVWQTLGGQLLVLGVSNSGRSKLFASKNQKNISNSDSFMPILPSIHEKIVGFSKKKNQIVYLTGNEHASSLVFADIESEKDVRRFQLKPEMRPKILIETENELWLWVQVDKEAGVENFLYPVSAASTSSVGTPVKVESEDFKFLSLKGVDHVLTQEENKIWMKNTKTGRRGILHKSTGELEQWDVANAGTGRSAQLATVVYSVPAEEKKLKVFWLGPKTSWQLASSMDVSDIQVESLGFFSEGSSGAQEHKLISSQRLDTASVLVRFDPKDGSSNAAGNFAKPQVLLKTLDMNGQKKLLVKEKGKYFWRFKLCSAVSKKS